MQTNPLIIQDSREQTPWHLPNLKVGKLDTGDYAIEGLEGFACIERKGAVSEFATNLSEERFRRELERMSKIAHPVVALEFKMSDLTTWPDRSGLPQKQLDLIRARGPYLESKLAKYQAEFPHVQFAFVRDRGCQFAIDFFQWVLTL